MKIAVLGYSGAGKSTLAKFLGEFYNIPVLHLDTVQFEPGWVERDRSKAKEIVYRFMQKSDWVIDGNYTGFYQQERLEQADRILLLEFSRICCFYRVWKRYRQNMGRVRESMAEGCEEKLDAGFIFWVLFQGRTSKRRKHLAAIAESYPQKTLVLKNSKQVQAYQMGLETDLILN